MSEGEKLNCWEVMECGRTPGGPLADELGVCGAAIDQRSDGVNGGRNAGRTCWIVAGTLCGGNVQSSFAHKVPTCTACEFYRRVREEEGSEFDPGANILSRFYGPLDMARAYETLCAQAVSMAMAEERERQLIATELHDRIGQSLVVAKMRVDAVRARENGSSKGEELERISDLLDDVIRETRTLTFEISPPVLHELGLEAACAWLVEQIKPKYDHIDFVCECDNKPKRLEPEVRVILFHAARELLMNAIKHSGAKTIRLVVRRQPRTVMIEVEDDGKGFDDLRLSRLPSAAGGFGLFSLRSRIGFIGGRFDVHSEPGHGSRIRVAAPYGDESEEQVSASCCRYVEPSDAEK